MRIRVFPVVLIAVLSLVLAGCDFSGVGASQPGPITSITKKARGESYKLSPLAFSEKLTTDYRLLVTRSPQPTA
jgi:hypothetical protein